MRYTVAWFVLGFAAAVALQHTHVTTVTVSRVDVVSRIVRDEQVPPLGYSSPLVAVRAASNRYNPDSIARNREHVGGILRCAAASYFYTHGAGKPGQAPVAFSIAVPAGCVLLCLWHTHGGPFDNRELFSPSDTHTANRLSMPIYMTNHTGRLLVYRPGQERVGRKRSKRSVVLLPGGSSRGELVRTAAGEPVRIATR